MIHWQIVLGLITSLQHYLKGTMIAQPKAVILPAGLPAAISAIYDSSGAGKEAHQT